MAAIVCSECRADLDAERIRETSRCPFCGATVDVQSEATPTESASLPTDNSHRVLPPLPPDTRIQVADHSTDRLLLYIDAAPNPRARSLGVFALLWNTVIGVISFLMIRQAFFGPKARNPGWGFVPFLGIFGVAGLVMAYAWLRLRFVKTILLLEENRVVIQTVLFRFKKIQEWTLTPQSSASLVSSYEENKRPVYAVAISTATTDAKFGSSLPDLEKNWLVDILNTWLQPERFTVTESGDVIEKSESFPEVRPEDLPPDSKIIIDEAAEQRLRFHFPMMVDKSNSTSSNLARFFFLFVWYAILAGVVFAVLHAPLKGAEWIFAFIMIAPFAVFPIFIIAISSLGGIAVDLDEARLQCRYYVGPFSYTKTMLTSKIISVEARRDFGMESRRMRPASTGMGVLRCLIRGPKDDLLTLTLSHPEDLTRTLAGLIHTKLVDLGQLPPTA